MIIDELKHGGDLNMIVGYHHHLISVTYCCLIHSDHSLTGSTLLICQQMLSRNSESTPFFDRYSAEILVFCALKCVIDPHTFLSSYHNVLRIFENLDIKMKKPICQLKYHV